MFSCNDLYVFCNLNVYSFRLFYRKAYIGLTDLSIEEQWVWEDESVTKYLNFASNQPDNWHGMEDCVVMSTTSNGKWSDVACNIKYNFVCKQTNGKNKLQQ